MASEAHDHSYWFILFGAFAGAAAFVLFALTMILQVFAGHGSHAGNILRVGLGVGSLFLGFFLVAIGTLYRLSFDEEQGSEFR